MKPRLIASGLVFPEGPAFDRAGDLYVVERRAGVVSRLAPPDGPGRPWERRAARGVFARPGGSPNGAAFGPDGALYVCNAGERVPETDRPDGVSGRLERIGADGRVEVIARDCDAGPLSSPNDLVFDAQGNLYFTDPVWGAIDLRQSAPGHVCFRSSDGRTRRLHTGLLFPNGIGLSPDGGTLLVAESLTARVHAFEVRAPGVLGPPREFAFLGERVIPDGLALDAAGNALVCGHRSGRIFVFPPAGGRCSAQLEFEDPDLTNVCFGGPERRTLFVTESGLGRVVALEWERPGLELFPERAP
jgi:gluconolactonase